MSEDKYQPLRTFRVVPGGWMAQMETLNSVLLRAQGDGELRRALGAFCAELGLEMCGHLSLFVDGAAEDLCWTADSRMAGYVDAYLEQGLYRIDPVARRCLREVLPVPWGLAHQRRRMSGEERKLYGMLDNFSLRRGLAVPIHGADSFSMLGIVVGGTERDFLARLPELSPLMQLLASSLHDAVIRRRGVEGEVFRKLSAREQECLAWSAAGMAAPEIAARLNISVNTVYDHLNRCRTKLGANTLIQAVAIAVGRGMIQP